MSLLQHNSSQHCGRFGFFFINANNQIVYDHTSIVAVVVARSWGFLIVLKTIAAIEELADVSAHVGGQNESAAWVCHDEVCDIKHHIIQYHELSAFFHLMIEHGRCVVRHIMSDSVLIISSNELLVPNFHDQERNEEEKDVQKYKPIPLM